MKKKKNKEFEESPITKINIFGFRDRRQIAFVTLNVFCPLSNPPPTPCSWRTILNSMEYQAKLNEKYMPVLQCIPSYFS